MYCIGLARVKVLLLVPSERSKRTSSGAALVFFRIGVLYPVGIPRVRTESERSRAERRERAVSADRKKTFPSLPFALLYREVEPRGHG